MIYFGQNEFLLREGEEPPNTNIRLGVKKINTSGKMIFYKVGYKYQLYKEYLTYAYFLEKYHVETKYFLIDDGTLIIKDSYCWDGASGPTFDSKSTMRASLVHDVLCQCIAYNLLPKTIWRESNELLYKMMLEDGAWKWRAKMWLNALNWFGKPEQKKVEIAP